MLCTFPEGMVLDPVLDRATGQWLCRVPKQYGTCSSNRPMTLLEEGVPSLPSGQRLNILVKTELAGEGEFAEHYETGGRLWRSIGALCRWLASQRGTLRGSSILELGCGTGAGGLYAASLGATRVVLTDGGTSELLALVQANVNQNRELYTETSVRVEHYLFGTERLPVGRFDMAIASDVTYSVNEARDALCCTLRALLMAGTRCIIAHEHRRSDMFSYKVLAENRQVQTWSENDVCLRTFLDSAAAHGLRVVPLLMEPGWREQDGEAVRMTTDLSVLEVFLT